MGLFFKADLVQFAPRAICISGHEYCLKKAEAGALARLLLLEKEVYAGRLPWDEEVFAEELRRRDSLYLLLLERDFLAGAIGCRFSLSKAHITFLAVVPKEQGQGIGSHLVQTVLDLAKSADLKTVTLEVRVENRKAQELYRRLGFEDNFVRKNYYNNDDCPDSDGLNMICHLRKKN